jgi:hypothetical protein
MNSPANESQARRMDLGTPSDIKSECARPRAQYVRR